MLIYCIDQHIDDIIHNTARLPLGCSGQQEHSFYADKGHRNKVAHDKILDIMRPFPDMQPLILDMLESKRARKERECIEQGVLNWMWDETLNSKVAGLCRERAVIECICFRRSFEFRGSPSGLRIYER